MSNLFKSAEAETIVKPHVSTFNDIFNNSLKKFNSVVSSYDAPLYGRAKATLLHNILVNETKAAYKDNKEVQIFEKYSSITLVIDNTLAGRFKKLNNNKRPSNINTKRNKNWVNQQLSLQFMEYPKMVSFDIGYQIDLTWTEFNSLQAICFKNGEQKWTIPIVGTEQILKPINTGSIEIKTTGEENDNRFTVNK